MSRLSGSMSEYTVLGIAERRRFSSWIGKGSGSSFDESVRLLEEGSSSERMGG